MATPRAFAANMERIAVKIDRNSTVLLRRTALAADQAVVIGTPVDTGRARSNWLVNFGNPASGTVESHGTSAAAESLSAAAAKIATARVTDTIHITNNLDYIEALNQGHSKQAPAGFVQAAVNVARDFVRSFSMLGGSR